jgi:hypothetical protein
MCRKALAMSACWKLWFLYTVSSLNCVRTMIKARVEHLRPDSLLLMKSQLALHDRAKDGTKETKKAWHGLGYRYLIRGWDLMRVEERLAISATLFGQLRRVLPKFLSA